MPKHGSKHHPVEGHSDPICALVEELNEAAKALYDARVALDKANVHHAAMLRRVSVAQLALDDAMTTRRKEAGPDTRWGRGS
jgi:hypothetical protein